MRQLTLVSDPATVNAALEVWYIQNRIAGGLPFTLTQDTGHLHNGVIIYLDGHLETVTITNGKYSGNSPALATEVHPEYIIAEPVFYNWR